MPGADLVAGAIPADGAAKRNVNVKPERVADAIGPAQQRPVVVFVSEGVVEAICRRVGGIARPTAAEALEQRLVDLQGRGSCQLHDSKCAAGMGASVLIARKAARRKSDIDVRNFPRAAACVTRPAPCS